MKFYLPTLISIITFGLALSNFDYPQAQAQEHEQERPQVRSQEQVIRYRKPEAKPLAPAFEYYLAPELGLTQSSNSKGTDSKDTAFSWGIEAMLFRKHFGAGLHFVNYQGARGGTSQVNVERQNRMLTAEAKYKIWEMAFSPYVTAGAGVLFEELKTKVMGQTEEAGSSSFLQNIGIGAYGPFTEHFGMNVSIKYFAASNINGLVYILSLGYLALDLL